MSHGSRLKIDPSGPNSVKLRSAPVGAATPAAGRRPGARCDHAKRGRLGDPGEVSRDNRAQDSETRPLPGAARIDYTGAVYGSLLAASVVVSAEAFGAFPRLELVLLLLCTGVVFWAAHVFARLFGARIGHQPLSRGEVRRVCADEWPIVEAAVPPAGAVAISPLLGLGEQGTAWLALAVAVAGQVGWATAAAVRVGAPGRLVVTAGAVNLLLGLIIVVVKVALQH